MSTHHVQVRKRILESGFYKNLFENHPDAIYVVDLQGRYQDANPSALQLCGYSYEELTSMSFKDIVAPEYLQKKSESYQKAFEGTPQRYETVIINKNGDRIETQVTNVPIVENGEVIGSFGVARDVTALKAAERRLQESERLQLAAENEMQKMALTLDHAVRIAGIGLWEWDIVTDTVRWCDRMHRIMGLEPGQIPLTSNTMLHFTHPDDLETLKSAVIQSLQNATPIDGEVRIVRLDGSVRYVHSRGEVVKDDTGRPVRMLGTMLDITNHKLQDRMLYESKQRYKSLVKYNPAGLFALDLEGNIISANPAFERMTGYCEDELKQKDFRRAIVPEEVEQAEALLKLALNGEPVADVEFTFLRKDRQIVHAIVSSVPIVVRGELVGLYVIVRDVTEKIISQQKLRESEERYHRLVDNSLDAIGIIENGKWVFMNHTGLSLFGATSEKEVIGRSFLEFLHPDHYEEHQRRVDSILAGYPVDVVEQKWFTLQGDTVYAEVTGVPFNENAIQLIIRDVTDRKKSTELLLRSEKLSSIGQLAAGVAHEIRNPLTSLKGFTQLLRKSSRNPKRRYFDIMESELNRIETILRELLILGKTQAVTFKPHDVALILQEVITLLGTQAVMNNVVMLTDFDTDVPLVNCEENQLKQVFLNIIKNAIEAMPSGGQLIIHVECQGEHIHIKFVDEGVGVPEQWIGKLGEPFFTTKEKGTGLGLMVSHKIIMAHHGSLHIESQPGCGTTVEIVLPAMN